MTRNLKVLGLALLAVFAFSAVAASGASAAQAKFTCAVAAGELCEIHAEQAAGTTDTFTIEGVPSPLTCVIANATGFLEESEVHKKGPESPWATFTPEYKECHVVLLGVTKFVTVTHNECRYTFEATKNTASTPFSADLTIICKEPKQIEIHVYNDAAHKEEICTYDVRHQTIKDQIQLTNEFPAGKPDDVLAHVNAKVLVHNTKPVGVCGVLSTPNAIYKGTQTIRGTNEAKQFVNSTVS